MALHWNECFIGQQIPLVEIEVPNVAVFDQLVVMDQEHTPGIPMYEGPSIYASEWYYQ